VRLKRYLDGEKKSGQWRWRLGPFSGTRELNGLRVMMALINNWDLKDENNSVYDETDPTTIGDSEEIYMVSDLGSSFGTAGPAHPHEKAKGNIGPYSRSKFLTRITPYYVDFQVPARPALVYLVNPREFFSRLRLRWIGKGIPRRDAKWVGELLGRLSTDQIRDAFRAGGYSPQEVEAFTKVLKTGSASLTCCKPTGRSRKHQLRLVDWTSAPLSVRKL